MQRFPMAVLTAHRGLKHTRCLRIYDRKIGGAFEIALRSVFLRNLVRMMVALEGLLLFGLSCDLLRRLGVAFVFARAALFRLLLRSLFLICFRRFITHLAILCYREGIVNTDSHLGR